MKRKRGDRLSVAPFENLGSRGAGVAVRTDLGPDVQLAALLMPATVFGTGVTSACGADREIEIPTMAAAMIAGIFISSGSRWLLCAD